MRSAHRSARDFQWFWSAAAVSNLGDGIRIAALPLLALELTDDSRLIAGATAMSFLPWIVFGPFAGALADRHDRRKLILAGQALRGLAVTALAIAVSTGRATIGLLYIVALVAAAGETVVDSSSQAALPHLVDDAALERANAHLTIAENLFNNVVGIAVGAFLFSVARSGPFYVDAATFVVGASLVATIKRPLQGDRATEPQSVRSAVAEGLRYLFEHRFLRTLACSVAITNLAINMGFGVLVVLVIDEIGASEATYGTILAIGAFGGVAGASIAGRLVTRLTPKRTLELTHIPFVAAAIVFATATNAWMASIAFALSSFALVIFQIPSRAMRQRVTPDHLLGRVVAAFRFFGLGGPVIGAPLGGVIAQAANVRWAFAASAIVLLVGWALAVRAASSYRTTASPP